MRICSDCTTEKPLDQFGPDGRRKDGISARCIACREARRKESNRKSQAKNPNRLEAARAWREKNPDYQREWAAKNPGKARAYQIKCLYGITIEQYDEMLEAQGGGCAICGREEETLRVDHNHETGEVRGLLCHHCNVSLGLMGDDADRLLAAALYLIMAGREAADLG